MTDNAVIKLIESLNEINENLERIANALEPPLPDEDEIEAVEARHEMVRDLYRRNHSDR